MTKRHLDIANSTAFAAHPCWDLLAEVAKESEHLDNFHDYISNIYSFFFSHRECFEEETFLSKWQNFGTKGGGGAVLVKPFTSSASGNLTTMSTFTDSIQKLSRLTQTGQPAGS